MYGDTARIRARARELRDLSDDVSARASVVDRSALIEWSSKTAQLFRAEIAAQAIAMRMAARALDEAAESLERHAGAVDAVKQDIEEAAEWVSNVWNSAQRTVANVIEKTVDGFSAVFTELGRVVPSLLADQAERILWSHPRLPFPGSVEWLGLADTFSRNNWRQG